MLNIKQYVCESELLPLVEATLAMHAYTIEEPLQRQVNGGSFLIMARETSIVLLVEHPQQSRAEITIWDDVDLMATTLLEACPIPVQPIDAPASARRQHT